MRIKNAFSSRGLFYFTAIGTVLSFLGATPSAQAQTQTSQDELVKTITISQTPSQQISPLIYGTNYTWTEAPLSTFLARSPSDASWLGQTQTGLSSTFNRYPGGWDGEWYDWTDYLANHANQMAGGTGKYKTGATPPGVPPEDFLYHMEPLIPFSPPGSLERLNELANSSTPETNASFQLPIHSVIGAADQTINMPLPPELSWLRQFVSEFHETPAALENDVQGLVLEYHQIVDRFDNPQYGGRQIKYWEIGNEWWLQNAGAGHPQVLPSNLARYAYLIAEAVPVLKASHPLIKIYASADWTTVGTADDQFSTLRAEVDQDSQIIPAADLCALNFPHSQENRDLCNQISKNPWASIDGISIHPYCGETVPDSTCASLPEKVSAIMSETGKSDIYASEWSAASHQMPLRQDFDIKNANATVGAFRDVVAAGIREATYWPVVSVGTSTSLLNADYSISATGWIFYRLAELYEGQALPVTITSPGGAGATVAVAARNDIMGTPGVGIVIATNGDGQETIEIPLADVSLPNGGRLSKVRSSSVIYADDPNSFNQTWKTDSLPVSIVKAPNGDLMAEFTLNPGTNGRGQNWEIGTLELQ